ncbi:MAG: translation initiation factor IF-2 [Syntrophaceae bacterium]
MSKTRVYELARELGVENKDLLARLEKLGIKNKKPTSSMEDGEVEKIKREFRTSEPHEMEETRVKSTVIRRRAVRTPAEEGQAEIEEEKPVEAAPEPAPVAQEKKEEIKKPEAIEPVAKAPEKEPPAPVTVVKAVESQPKKEPAIIEEKKPAPAKPVIEPAREPKAPASAAAPAAPRVVKEVTAPKPEKPAKPGIVKGWKKGKKPVEVVMEEAPGKKKTFFKKLVDKKDTKQKWERDRDEERAARLKDDKRGALTRMKKTEITTPKAIKRRIRVKESIRVGDLAKNMGVKASDLMSKLIALGIMASINQSLDIDTATLIAADFGYQIEPVEFDEAIQAQEMEARNLQPRAPVVTVMGHVDHGKTSLLDAIRQTNVIDGEAGGITQAIGAYHVNVKNRDIVFLDTPGHEAFTSMRARGAKVTDIVVLVVAADDGVMEQTVEAINHAKAANVPIIVAVNKIDKPGANPERIMRELSDYNLISEEWGGDTLFAQISAKKKTGIEELLELILLQADVMELKADPDRPAKGVIVEAKLDKGRGPVATVLIQEGTLKEGDTFVCKTEFGKVRAMLNDKGSRMKEAGPSMPVEVIGFSSVPQAGSDFNAVEDEKKARSISEYWVNKEREKDLAASAKVTLEQLYERIKEGTKELNVVIKADVQGSVEALSESLQKLSTADVKLKVIHSSIGTITETDVLLASASDAVIIGFKVRPDSRVIELAKAEGVEIKLYDIIYNVINDVKDAMVGLLEPIYKEISQGRAEVKEIFKVPKVGTIAGSVVTEGKISRDSNLRLVRDGVMVYDGKLVSLRRFKDDVREVVSGLECGIGIEGFNDIKVGDMIEAYTREEIERKL